MNYDYNIRGWMTRINDVNSLGNDLFAYKINYNTLDITNTRPYQADQGLEVKKRYNGNISQVDWVKVNRSLVADKQRSYGYSYDGLNRLKAGFYYEKNSGQYLFTEEHNELLKYDPNGNIEKLKRFSYKAGTASSMIDDLHYQYTGNRLTSIADTSLDANGYEGGGNTIDYDINGNMTSMLDKSINSIAYNHLNLPNAMDLGSGKMKASNSSIYRADGTKLRKVYTSRGPGTGNTWVTTVATTDYLDGFQYLDRALSRGSMTVDTPDMENDLELALEREAFQREESIAVPIAEPGNGVENAALQLVPTAEGYYSFTENRYIYQYKDHLGNTRVSFARNSAGGMDVTDGNDYYPFGMNHLDGDSGSHFGQSSYKNYKFQEQELQETGFYSFKWRQYMPDLGRFFNIDPLNEKYAYQSHYNFSENKVVSHRELEGLEAIPAGNFNKNQTSLVVLGLGRANGRAGDGVGSGTNTLYSNLPKNLQTDGALSSLQNNLGSNIAVAAYTGTDSGLASTHMVETISNYRSVNPDGNVVMIGHSLGGRDVLNAANLTSETINLVLTMDPMAVNAGGGPIGLGDYSSATTKLNGNTQNIISLSSTDSYANGGGGSRSNNSQQSVKSTMTGTSHVNIDDSVTPYLKPLIQRTDQGVNPVKWFQNVNWNNFQVQPNVRTGNQEKKGTGSGS